MVNIKVLVVDDHPLLLKGIKSYLQNEPIVSEVFIATNYEEVFQICNRSKIDILLMDLNLGKTSGIQLTRKIKNCFPRLSVLGFSADNDETQIKKMIKAGADGYILKDTDIDELKVAFQFIMNGKTFFSSSISEKTIAASYSETSKLVEIKNLLTSREFEILNYLIEKELGNKEIAEKLFISPRTVETHKRNLIQKLKVRNAVGLAKFYIENGQWLKEIYGIPVG